LSALEAQSLEQSRVINSAGNPAPRTTNHRHIPHFKGARQVRWDGRAIFDIRRFMWPWSRCHHNAPAWSTRRLDPGESSPCLHLRLR